MLPPEPKELAQLGHGLLVSAPGFSDIPLLEPMVEHQAHHVPSHSLCFTPQAILTAGNEPCVRVWARPGHVSIPLSCESFSLFPRRSNRWGDFMISLFPLLLANRLTP